MFCKIVLVLATVCVVKASVLTNNAFDVDDAEQKPSNLEDLVSQIANDPETGVPNDASRCFVSDCTRQCRRLGFSNGICISGQCFCRHSTAQGNDVEQAPSNLEDLVLQLANDPETGVPNDASRCFVADCTRQCRRLGFSNGICISGQCFCRHSNALVDDVEQKPSNLEDLVSQIANDPETGVPNDASRCFVSDCTRQCRRLGFSNGICISGQCFCRHSNAQENDPETEIASNPRQCIPSHCKQQCRRQGFGNGYCVAGQCRCTFIKTQVDDAELFNLEDLVSPIENDPETEIARNPLKCDDAACNRKCRDKGFARGGCYLGRCKCRR